MSDLDPLALPPHPPLTDPMPPILLGGTVNLLAGAPGTGKTAFLIWWIQRLAQGLPVFGVQPLPIPFQGLIAADRSWDRSTVRWFNLGGMGDFPHYSLQDDRGFKKARLRNKRDRIAILDESLNALAPGPNGIFPHGSIVYVDPLALFLGGNLNDYDSCAVACSEIREICLQRGIVIIGTAHAGKQQADKKARYLRLQDRILGSAALFGYTDTQFYLASPAEVDRSDYVFLWCPHHAPSQTFAMGRDEHGLFLPLGEIEEGGPKGQHPSVVALSVLDAFVDQPELKLPELLAWASTREMSRASLMRYLQVCAGAGHLERPVGTRGVYRRTAITVQ